MNILDLNHAIDMVRHTQIIEDPFPEETEAQRNKNLRFFRYAWKHIFKEEKQISIHAAYRMGYLKAYTEIKQNLSKYIKVTDT